MDHVDTFAEQLIHSVIIASAVQIDYIQAFTSYTDLLHSIWRVIVCGQVVQVTSIMTATIPFLKPFLASLDSGFLDTNTVSRAATYALSAPGKTEHPLSYIKLGNHQSRNQFEGKDRESDIWVMMEVVIKRAPKLGVDQAKYDGRQVDRCMRCELWLIIRSRCRSYNIVIH